MSVPKIVTTRLVLAPFRATDAGRILEYRSDPEVCRYQTWEPDSLEEVERFIEELAPVQVDTPGMWFQFGVRLRDTDALIGDIGVHFLAEEPHQAEIGFTLAPDSQGRGFATEGVIGVLGYLFGPLAKHRVFASVDPTNEPSIALLQRVGMRQEAHFRKNLWFKGDWVDDLVFGILESEFGDR